MTNHFSGLTEAEQERLAILMEECAEVIKIGAKILRHGYASTNNGRMHQSNRCFLEDEMGDVIHAIDMMRDRGDVTVSSIEQALQRKRESIKPYLHHQ